MKKGKRLKTVSLDVCNCEDFSMFGGVRGEINQHEQSARSACDDGDGKREMPRLQGEESRLEPQLRHIGSDDPNFHLGIERGD